MSRFVEVWLLDAVHKGWQSPRSDRGSCPSNCIDLMWQHVATCPTHEERLVQAARPLKHTEGKTDFKTKVRRGWQGGKLRFHASQLHLPQKNVYTVPSLNIPSRSISEDMSPPAFIVFLFMVRTAWLVYKQAREPLFTCSTVRQI